MIRTLENLAAVTAIVAGIWHLHGWEVAAMAGGGLVIVLNLVDGAPHA